MIVRKTILSCLALSLGGPAVVASEGGGVGQSLIQPQIGTIFWTLLTFLLMLVLLGRYAWGPLLGAIKSRETTIRDSLDQARRDREDAERLLQQQRELLAEARRDRAEALEQGRREAEALKAELLEHARQQRDQLLKQTEAQISASLRQARGELRSIAADLAIRAAEKLLVKNLDDATQRKMVEDYLAELERTSGGSRSLPS